MRTVRTTIAGMLLAIAVEAAAYQIHERDFFPEAFVPLPGSVAVLPPVLSAAYPGLPPPEAVGPWPTGDGLPPWPQPALPAVCTNALRLLAGYEVPPLPGRVAWLRAVYTNASPGTFGIPAPGNPLDEVGVRLLRAEADGSRTPLPAERPPWHDDYVPRLKPGESMAYTLRLPPSLLAAAAGSEGIVAAYATRLSNGCYLYAESAPLPVPAEPWEGGPPPLTQAQWRGMVTNWVQSGFTPNPREFLKDFPDAAPFFPGTLLDATLPEAFRLEFAKDMPFLDLYDPSVYAFITNATDKAQPVVTAALRVFRKMRPEEEGAAEAKYQAHLQLQAMADDPAVAVSFRQEIVRGFLLGLGRNLIQEFGTRTDPNLRLLLAQMVLDDHLRGQGAYTPENRAFIVQTLQGLCSSTDAYVPDGWPPVIPLDGVTTVGPAAQMLVQRFDTLWPVEP